MITNHELQSAIDDMAKTIAQVERYPENWESWAVYLLESLEQLAIDDRRKGEFEKMLKKLAHDIASRVNLGSW